MSFTVQQHHVLQFSRNVEHLLQQGARKLPMFVESGSYTGKAGSPVDQVGTIGRIRNRASPHRTRRTSRCPATGAASTPNSITSST